LHLYWYTGGTRIILKTLFSSGMLPKISNFQESPKLGPISFDLDCLHTDRFHNFSLWSISVPRLPFP
jgi:hypothetical protein